MQTGPAQRFDALDGIRGLAALAVMVYHFTSDQNLHHLPGAWAAVDLFFILSGFVLAHSYTGKIRQGLSAWRFAALRLIRLAPLYLIGTAIGGVAIGLLLVHGEAGTLSTGTYWRGVALAMGLIPNFDLSEWPSGSGFQGAVLFPLNPPAWSLFFELFVNACFFGFVALRLQPRWPWALLMLLVVAGLEWRIQEFNPGWGRWNFFLGFPRVIAEFYLGMVLYDLHQRVPRMHWLPVLTLSTALFAIFFQGDRSATMLEVMLLAPCALVCAARLELDAAWQGACQRLGELSYPLYITHMPVFFMGHALWPGARPDPSTWLLMLSLAAVLTAAALIPADRFVRRHLMAAYHSHAGGR